MTHARLENSLREAVEAGTPVEMVDPVTNRVYYLISAEEYLKLGSARSGDFDPREGYPFIGAVMTEDDANDPLLESYQ